MAAEDIVSRVEKRIEGVVKRSNETFDAVLKHVPRALGSEKVSGDDDLEEYLLTVAMTDDPKTAFSRRIEERVQQGHSTEQALTWAVDWVEKNEKKIAEMNGKVAVNGKASNPATPAVDDPPGGVGTVHPTPAGVLGDDNDYRAPVR